MHKKFIIKTLLSCCLFTMALEGFIRLYSDDLFVFDWRQHTSVKIFEKKMEHVEILFMGDSYVYHGINPEVIHSKYIVHNFGLGGETIDRTYFKLKYYLNKKLLPNLKIVVLNLESRHLPSREINYITDYSKFTDDSEYYNELPILNRIDSYLSNHLYLWRCKTALTGLKFKINFRENLNEYGQGERSYHLTENELTNKCKLIKDESISYTKDIDPLKDKYYKSIYNLCKNNKIKIIFLQIPNIAQIDSKIIFPKDADRNDDAIEKYISMNFPNSANINLKKISEDLTIQDFFDESHLNKDGSKKVGLLINRALKKFTKNK